MIFSMFDKRTCSRELCLPVTSSDILIASYDFVSKAGIYAWFLWVAIEINERDNTD